MRAHILGARPSLSQLRQKGDPAPAGYRRAPRACISSISTASRVAYLQIARRIPSSVSCGPGAGPGALGSPTRPRKGRRIQARPGCRCAPHSPRRRANQRATGVRPAPARPMFRFEGAHKLRPSARPRQAHSRRRLGCLPLAGNQVDLYNRARARPAPRAGRGQGQNRRRGSGAYDAHVRRLVGPPEVLAPRRRLRPPVKLLPPRRAVTSLPTGPGRYPGPAPLDSSPAGGRRDA